MREITETKLDRLVIEAGEIVTAPALAKCGDVDIYEGGTLNAPALAKCGYFYIRAGGTLNAPVLAERIKNAAGI